MNAEIFKMIYLSKIDQSLHIKSKLTEEILSDNIRILGHKFIKNNINKAKLIINNKKYRLKKLINNKKIKYNKIKINI